MQIHSDTNNQQNAIKFFDNISYKFDLDHAQLSAELTVPNVRLNSSDRCQLQLWACDTPFNGDRLRGVKIAESTYIQAGQEAAIFNNVPATLPAGNRDFAMVMALVSADHDGREVIEDYVNFSQRQQFAQPRLGALAQTNLDADALNIVIDSIENPRDQDNLSGDLSLEIWSVATPYQGGNVDGRWLGGLNIGQLVGGEIRNRDEYNIRFDQSTLQAGDHLVLMLREWTANGFITRDFRDLQLPVSVATPSVSAPTATTAAQVQIPGKTTAATKKNATASKAATAAATNNKSRKKLAADTASVSVNSASADELIQVKGVSASVANNIVAQRPYRKLDDLLRVTGIGPKLLERIKAMLKL